MSPDAAVGDHWTQSWIGRIAPRFSAHSRRRLRRGGAGRICSAQAGALADVPRPEWNGGLAFSGQGEADHSVVHERRSQPGRSVRLQAGTRRGGTASRSIPATARMSKRPRARPAMCSSRRSRCGSMANAAAGSAISCRIWRNASTTWRFSWRCRAARMCMARQLFDEHRFSAAGLSLHGLVDQLRPGKSDRRSADVRRAARPARPAVQRAREISAPAFCR